MDNTQEDYKKSYENLLHYFEELLGYRPKLNKFETFLVNDLSIPRKYVQPRWSIGLDRIIKNTNKPVLPTATNNFLDQTIKLINLILKTNPNIHKTTSGSGYIPSRKNGGEIPNRFYNGKLLK